jgi:hypothetical protein
VKAGLEREYIGDSPNRRHRTPEDIEAELARFDTSSSLGNPVDVARRVMDEYVLLPAARAVEEHFADQPLVRANIHDAIGRTYQALGLYEDADSHLQTSLDIRRRELGAQENCTAMSIRKWREA